MHQKPLSKKEKKVLGKCLKDLKVSKPKTKVQIVVAMVGLVGSGRENAATEISRNINAVLISADEIRVALRKEKERYDNVRFMVEEVAKEVLSQGGSVVIESDFISADKRNRFKKIAKDSGTKIYYVRTVCDIDIAIGRIISGRYSRNSFFGGASSNWQGNSKGAIIKMREMWRRTPHHYSWDSTGGGNWILKKLPFVFEELDNTDTKKLKKQINTLVKKLSR